MALYVKDPDVDAMARKLAAIRKLSKTEVLKQALRRELAQQESETPRIERARSFIRGINAERPTGEPLSRDFIDGLYE